MVPTPDPTADTSTVSAACGAGDGEHRVVGGHERLRHATGGDEVECRRHRDAMLRVHGEQLGLCAAAREPEDPIADRPALDARTKAHDLAGELHTRDVGGCSGWSGIEARPLREVAPVQSCTMDADEHLARHGDRIGPFLDDQLRFGSDAPG